MRIELTHRNANRLTVAMIRVYGDVFLGHAKKNHERQPSVIWLSEEGWKKRNRKRVAHMLNFKNDKGEIVMTENDKGELEIHDEVLKESLLESISLEEAQKIVKQKED